MDAEDVRDQGSDTEAAGDAEATVASDATDASEDNNLTDLLSDLGKAAQETAATLSDTVGEGEAAVRAGVEEAENTIRQHPLLAVGIAAGVGFMLGLLLRGSGQTDDD